MFFTHSDQCCAVVDVAEFHMKVSVLQRHGCYIVDGVVNLIVSEAIVARQHQMRHVVHSVELLQIADLILDQYFGGSDNKYWQRLEQ